MNKLMGYFGEIIECKMLSIQVNLLNKCTSHCKSCRKYTWPDVEIDYGRLTETILYLKNELGLQSIVFSGGDPILYKDMSKLMHFCYDNGVEFSLITTLITDDTGLLSEIARLAKRIHVSVDAVDRLRYQYIRGVEKFDIVDKNIQLIQRIRKEEGLTPIRISSTISKMNCDDVLRIYNFANSNGCDLNFYLIHTWDDLKMSDKDIENFYRDMRIVLDLQSEYGKIKTNAQALLDDRYKKDDNGWAYKQCGINKIHCLIDANGDIYPCCKLLDDNGEYGHQTQYAYGNIYGASLFNEFNKRFNKYYPLDCDLCRECSDRYRGTIDFINEFSLFERQTLFL